jgi:hypothetical protein
MASRRIFLDIEEALSREVRRISHHEARTVDKTIMRETFDPFSGEVIMTPVEPEFYDSSADAGVVQYPHFFIRLMKTREDRTSGRVVPQYGKWIQSPVKYSPKAFEIVLHGGGLVNPVGNDITTPAFQIRKVQVGFLIRMLEGNNIGTYRVASVTYSGTGDHLISVSNTLILNLPAFLFNATTRVITFTDAVDLNTIEVGDNFVDSGSNSFPITAVNAQEGKLTIGGVGTPVLSVGADITRTGNVLQNTDLSLVRYIVMDPSKPVLIAGQCGDVQGSSEFTGVSPAIPIDAYYLIRIDSKTRENHIDVLNRVWEEFNPPRTALPTIVRSALSADELLTVDITTGGSTIVKVGDNSNFKIGDPVFIIDDLGPSKRTDGEGFNRPFESVVTGLNSTDEVVLEDTVPDTFVVSKSARLISNAEFHLFMFHFVDHVTKDVEGSQYWVHEFTFWVQLWVDRLEEPSNGAPITSAVTDIAKDIEDIDTGHIYSEEF